jgi:predicted amidohydrolase YtcJ
MKKIAILAALAFAATELPAQQRQAATLAVTNAKIVTMDPARPRAEAMAVRGEWIIAIGSMKDVQPFIDGTTRVIDAGNRLVIPGFNDAHAHFSGGAAGLRQLNLYGVSSLAEVQRLVAERVKTAKPGEWITGNRYDHTLWGTAWPTKEDLDKVAPNNPVRLTRASGHSSWVNSMALRLNNITKDTPNPAAGEVQKDAKTGEPTGIMLETAQGLVRVTGNTVTPEEQRQRQRDDAIAGLKFAATLGVTSLQSSSSLNEMESLRQLAKDSLLTARFTGWLTLGSARALAAQGIRTGQGDDWVRVGFLKGFVDGTLGDGTAAMFEPFADRADFVGLPRMTQVELDSAVILADRLGFQIGIHAIGDKGSSMVLNAYEKAAQRNGTTDMRHRIEHAQLIVPDDIRRFGRLGVVASMQPTHATTDMRFADTRVGYDRTKTAYPWRSLLNSGAMLSFGTDWSVEPLDPMRGVFSAVTRTNIQRMEPKDGWFPEQKLSVWEAIYYYTYGSAYGEKMENLKGSLAVGRLADFLVMDRDLFVVPTEQILQAKVDYTIVGGRVVWDRATGAYGRR